MCDQNVFWNEKITVRVWKRNGDRKEFRVWRRNVEEDNAINYIDQKKMHGRKDKPH